MRAHSHQGLSKFSVWTIQMPYALWGIKSFPHWPYRSKNFGSMDNRILMLSLLTRSTTSMSTPIACTGILFF